MDLTILAVVGALLASAFVAGGIVLYREFYSPSAFVLRYLSHVAEGRAADALSIPGVTVDAAELEAAGLPATASEALLRPAALASLTDLRVLSEETFGTRADVTVSYRAGHVNGETVFQVVQDGWIGVVPAWRFATSPLAVINLTVFGSMRFEVNGFEIDKRQVSVDGAEADPLAPVPLLVLSPGVYSIAVDTALARTPGVAVLADAPMADTPVTVQAEATQEFADVVQQRVEEFLDDCTTQRVLHPTGCPFGYYVRNRVDGAPTWSIVAHPDVSVVPDGAGWRIPDAEGVAHIEVDIRSLADGSVRNVSEDVPFFVAGHIDVLPDGNVSIHLTGDNG